MDNFQKRRKKTPALPNCAYHFMNKMNDKHGNLRPIFDQEFKYDFVPVDYVNGPSRFEIILVIRRDNSSGYSKKSRYLVVIVVDNNELTHRVVVENLKTLKEADLIAINECLKKYNNS